ncbi:MAG: hypothetical protein ACOY0T_14165 [Myxococcota bacterium]
MRHEVAPPSVEISQRSEPDAPRSVPATLRPEVETASAEQRALANALLAALEYGKSWRGER